MPFNNLFDVYHMKVQETASNKSTNYKMLYFTYINPFTATGDNNRLLQTA